MPVPTLRTLTLTGSTLTETIRPGLRDTANPGLDAVTFATGVDRTRTVLSDVDLVPDASAVDIPIFRYFAFDSSTPPKPELLVNPGTGSLTTAQLASVAKISVSFRVLPAGQVAKPGSPVPRGSAVLQGDVYIRTADPNSPTPKPICL
jgi:hypothetical protein